MTDHITRLKEALEAGPTPGVWESKHRKGADGNYRTEIFSLDHGGIASLYWTPNHCGHGVTRTYREGNAAFIAAANPAAIRELLERLEQAEKDARRYGWLRSRVPGSAYRIAGVIYSEGGSGVDAAIDAAIASQEGGE